MADRVADLRSDTVTRPTPAMRLAMAEAPVGDDVFDEDPSLHELQSHAAALFGHEAALFTPSGSMANQIAIQLVVPRAEELLCDADAHIVTYEMGAAAAFGGISTRTWPFAGGALDPAAIADMIRQPGGYTVPTRAIAVEQTHNRGGGSIIPWSDLQALRAVCDEHGLLLHCDGARIWHAHVATGIPLAEYGRLFDTLSVCLSKGLGAPVGSLVIGSAERIAQARVIRKRLGGGMRQAGILAAAGLHALRFHIDRLAEDHAKARHLALALAPLGVVDPARVETNLVMLDLRAAALDAAQLTAAAGELGVLVSPFGPRTVRLTTHLDLTDEDVATAASVLTKLLT
ncbi:threonine aldolase family protein [Dactylosporangium siamense]|uniref:Threonine aldolase n=1 Tax=Dactylosporangium siamense TaxID=685454 RepID=A0A919PYK2_9ACTN|nr:GntG family PLP-dependent aldolase [Dactylosporangium siamense]GIG50913.1 threonine aldolase [Dactylosporangium siamense]